MGESMERGGAPDLPTARAAGAVLTEACAGAVTDVEWCARRRLPPDDLDVVVYRGTVDRADAGDYYVLLGAGTSRVFPAREYDSTTDLIAAFQARRREE
ncbi:MAG: hypothetical protein ABEH40_06020 [Haloferacaceae archaeon]